MHEKPFSFAHEAILQGFSSPPLQPVADNRTCTKKVGRFSYQTTIRFEIVVFLLFGLFLGMLL